MQDKEMQGLSLPELPTEPRQQSRFHFMAETPDGEGMSFGENELGAFLQKYGQAPKTESSERSPDSGSRS